MKRNMYWSLCLTAMGVAVITALLTLSSVYGLLLRQAKADLAMTSKLVIQSIAYTKPDTNEYLQALDLRLDSVRVTWIAPDGTVLFDSDNDQTTMENHLNRPEIAAAFSNGTGEDLRQSQTMGLNTYYFAQRLADDTVLRVSKQTRSIGAVFVSIIPIMAGILILIFLSGMFVASRLTRRMLRPIEQLSENIKNVNGLQGYEELDPFLQKIKEQNRLIEQQVEILRAERDTIRTITSNMKEGLILLDLQRNILSVNRSALSLLGIKGNDYTGKHLLHLTRDNRLTGCIDQAVSGMGADLLLHHEQDVCHIFASPVYQNEAICGVIVLLLDVTQQQKAEKIRRDFSANVSHELKTPLTSISGFAEMMQNGMVNSQADMKKFAGRIYHEASRLITLTDDIIRLSCIEEDTTIDMEPVELKRTCNGVITGLQYTAEQKDVVLTCTGEDVTVIGNPRMLDELVYNLVENAIKYNHPQGKVKILVKQEGKQAVISVTDTGIGISKEHQDRIFERFYRVDKSRSKQTGGTGLGLSIVKHIVERHNGTITLESAMGTGTTITVRLNTLHE